MKTYTNGKLQIELLNPVTEKKSRVNINKVTEGATALQLNGVVDQLQAVLADPVEKVTVVEAYEIR